jgi:hypothetical protein
MNGLNASPENDKNPRNKLYSNKLAKIFVFSFQNSKVFYRNNLGPGARTIKLFKAVIYGFS